MSVAAARPPPIALPGGRSKDYIVVDASPPRPAPRASTEAVTPARRRSSGAAKGVTQADVAGSTPPGQKPKLQPPMSLKKARLSSFAAAPGPAEAAAEDRILPDDPRSSADGPRQTLVHSTYGDGLEVAPRAVRASLIRKADLSSAAGDMLAVRPDMKKSRNKWVIDPRAAYMRKWDIVIITLLMFTSIVTPFEARSAPRLPPPPLRGSPHSPARLAAGCFPDAHLRRALLHQPPGGLSVHHGHGVPVLSRVLGHPARAVQLQAEGHRPIVPPVLVRLSGCPAYRLVGYARGALPGKVTACCAGFRSTSSR